MTAIDRARSRPGSEAPNAAHDAPDKGIRMVRVGRAAIAASLLILTTLPSASMMVLGASSLALGLAFSSVMVVLLFLWKARHIRAATKQLSSYGLALSALLGAIVGHGFVAAHISGFFDWTRAAFSLMLVALALCCAAVLRLLIEGVSSSDLTRAMRLGFAVFVAEGFLAILGLPAIGPALHALPIVFFIEPSHYALAFTPFLFFEVLRETGRRKALVVLASLAVALLIQSLTLLTAILLVTTLAMRPKWLAFSALAVLPLLYFVDVGYYLIRLDFGADVENLSALAFLQGWERAWLNIVNTHGIGAGFQQFGLSGDLGYFQERIEKIFDVSINLQDGGTTGAKLVGEFGVLGAMALFVYVMIVLRQLRRLRSLGAHDPATVRAKFFMAALLGGLMEFFVRGGGYMTPGMLLVAVGLLGSFSGPPRSAPRRRPNGGRQIQVA